MFRLVQQTRNFFVITALSVQCCVLLGRHRSGVILLRLDLLLEEEEEAAARGRVCAPGGRVVRAAEGMSGVVALRCGSQLSM